MKYTCKYLTTRFRVFLAGHTVHVAMVACYVTKTRQMCSPMIGQFFDTMIVTSTDKEWLEALIKILEKKLIKVLEKVRNCF